MRERAAFARVQPPARRNSGAAPRRRLTAARRQSIAELRLNYQLSEAVDFDTADQMPGEESWYVSVEHEGDHVGDGALHRVPLHNQRDLGWETDNGDNIPGHPVSVVTDFDSPAEDVMLRCYNPAQLRGESFVVVENLQLSTPWRDLGLEALLLSMVFDRLFAPDLDAFAVAEPAPSHLTGSARKDASAYHAPILTSLGFKPYADGVWLLADSRSVWKVRDTLWKRFEIRQDTDQE